MEYYFPHRTPSPETLWQQNRQPMHANFVISIPLVTSDKATYTTKRNKRIQKQFDSLEIKKSDHETIKLVRRHLIKLDPYCYPYNITVGFAEIYIDTVDILVNYILNGDKRKVFNRFYKTFRTNSQKYYDSFHPRAAGRFYSLTNAEVIDAMIETLDEILEQCKEWKITFDLEHYRRLLTSIDYIKFLSR